MNPGTKQMGMMISGACVFLLVCGVIGYIIYLIIQELTPSSPGSATPSPSTRVCASSPEFAWGGTPSTSMKLVAPTGLKIGSVQFASLGVVSGTCGAYTDGSCQVAPDEDVTTVVNGACIGEKTCTIPLTYKTFSTSSPVSCPGQQINMTVQFNAVPEGSFAVSAPQ